MDSRTILFLSLIIFTLIYGRSASRIFFLITPFVYLIIANLIIKSLEHAKKSKDELVRVLFWTVFVLAIIISILSLSYYYSVSSNNAKHMGPSAHAQWQSAMSWVREKIFSIS